MDATAFHRALALAVAAPDDALKKCGGGSVDAAVAVDVLAVQVRACTTRNIIYSTPASSARFPVVRVRQRSYTIGTGRFGISP
jgi:hypothetical protein